MDIPISAAKKIALDYDYDQVIIIGRKVGPTGNEHCTTYGVNKEHCAVAAKCGNFLKFKVMGWHKEQVTECAPVNSDAQSCNTTSECS